MNKLNKYCLGHFHTQPPPPTHQFITALNLISIGPSKRSDILIILHDQRRARLSEGRVMSRGMWRYVVFERVLSEEKGKESTYILELEEAKIAKFIHGVVSRFSLNKQLNQLHLLRPRR